MDKIKYLNLIRNRIDIVSIYYQLKWMRVSLQNCMDIYSNFDLSSKKLKMLRAKQVQVKEVSTFKIKLGFPCATKLLLDNFKVKLGNLELIIPFDQNTYLSENTSLYLLH